MGLDKNKKGVTHIIFSILLSILLIIVFALIIRNNKVDQNDNKGKEIVNSLIKRMNIDNDKEVTSLISLTYQNADLYLVGSVDENKISIMKYEIKDSIDSSLINPNSLVYNSSSTYSSYLDEEFINKKKYSFDFIYNYRCYNLLDSFFFTGIVKENGHLESVYSLRYDKEKEVIDKGIISISENQNANYFYVLDYLSKIK